MTTEKKSRKSIRTLFAVKNEYGTSIFRYVEYLSSKILFLKKKFKFAVIVFCIVNFILFLFVFLLAVCLYLA